MTYNNSMKKKQEQNVQTSQDGQAVQSQPYSDMKARKIVLILGFALTIASFVAALCSSLLLFVPGNGAGFSAISALYVIAMSCAFVGIVFAVAGANTNKVIARLSFFFGTVSFICSAGFLVVLLLVNFFPFNALGTILG